MTVEDCLEQVTDQFALVHLSALRYRQLHRGAKRLVDSKNKNIVTALREIAAGKVTFREDLSEVLLKTTAAAGQLDDGLVDAFPEDDLDAPLI